MSGTGSIGRAFHELGAEVKHSIMTPKFGELGELRNRQKPQKPTLEGVGMLRVKGRGVVRRAVVAFYQHLGGPKFSSERAPRATSEKSKIKEFEPKTLKPSLTLI